MHGIQRRDRGCDGRPRARSRLRRAPVRRLPGVGMQTVLGNALLAAMLAALLLLAVGLAVFWLCRYIFDAWSTVRRDGRDDAA